MNDEPIIDLQSDEYFMRDAIRQAAKAYEADEVPVGAVIVRNGRVIARAWNQVEMLNDATAHAEMLAIRRAAGGPGRPRLEGAALYTTLEPCAMCAGAVLLARVDRLVFAARDPKGGCAGSLYDLLTDPRFNHRVAVAEGPLAEESAGLLQAFFRARRNAAGETRG